MFQGINQSSATKQIGIPVHNREYFLAIPNEIIRFMYFFSGNEFKVLLYLLVTRNLKDKKYGSIDNISKNTGFHSNTVYSIVKSLHSLGLAKSARTKNGIMASVNFVKDESFKNIFNKIQNNICAGHKKIFPGVRYLYFKDKEKKDFSNSTFLDNLFSSFLVKLPGEERAHTLDSENRSYFKELTGNHLKLIVYFKYLSQFKDCEVFKASYKRIEKSTGLKRTSINKLLKDLCSNYQFIGKENYRKNRKQYFFNYSINGVTMSEKRAASKAKDDFTKSGNQNSGISQKTDFQCTKQMNRIIKEIDEAKSLNEKGIKKIKEIQFDTRGNENRVGEPEQIHKQRPILKDNEKIDFNFILELEKLKGNYYANGNSNAH